jgi:hypothetical protein
VHNLNLNTNNFGFAKLKRNYIGDYANNKRLKTTALEHDIRNFRETKWS